MHKYDVLIRPIMTEKTEAMGADNYVFEVARAANKQQVREAIESIFGVKVLRVRTMVNAGKSKRWGRHVRRMSSWKKAIITVRPGDQIDLLT
jgi:large subunit ribosomal protein L23